MVLKVCKCGAWHKQRPCPDCQKKKERGKQARNKELGRNLSSWQRFRERILDRDQYTCRDCNTKPYQPHVHLIGGGVHSTSPADRHRYLTLCASCHSRRQRAEQEERAGTTR
jgi:hypothetical protein